jgi:glyoxylase I family protein
MTIDYRPSHFGLCVSDIAAARRFYCDGLGFETVVGYDLDTEMLPGLGESLEVEGPVKVRSEMIQRSGMVIELLAYETPAVTGSPSASRGALGLTHLSFYVDDLHAATDRLVAHGGTVLPRTRQSLGIELVFLVDPDGTRIELMQTAT